ncbi:alpha/beta fold hydrolase [Pseudomonas nitroreducens]|uniref:alpha/beta hydrolase family esterase n=1 Tax=Pseudomonas TaxID=286 RepID=UPI000AB1C7F0|nr:MULTISPECIES: alpha/beta fold hydrolase [Pseudomonas]MDG9854382.1 alpha/beta fold hydrolase [Pseudomonas nitroreducens]NMZ71728.1 alpha/beta fold hydrolase [Pseudomonas nitroreducens]NNN24904.1 alpha/beta fold hydrolase [Pseudomonas nitroreducens]UCL86619.1 alpha/beta fold hydrolase [Pseudomonas sp. HS-18]
MRVAMRIVQGLIALLVLALLVGGWWYVPGELMQRPTLTGSSEDASLRQGQRRRSYVLYVPQKLAERPALLVVLHSSQSNGERMRRDSGYRFDALADRDGFLVLYPDGFEGHWNDCRRVASYSARQLNIDDVGFLSDMIARLQRERGVDPARVFVTGYSNGGQMALRMAAEAPDKVAGVAAVAASLPSADNDACRPAEQPRAALLMNGTRDPINPYAGGRVTLFGFGDRGNVLSAEDSALALARRNGQGGEPQVDKLTLPGPVWTQRQRWAAGDGPPVELVTVFGGGHLISQPLYRPPRMLGQVDPQLDGPAEIWRFFSELSPGEQPHSGQPF